MAVVVTQHKRPLKIFAAFFALYGLYSFWWATHGYYWSGGLSAAMSIATTLSLLLGYRWSQHVVYASAAMVFGYFVWTLWALLGMGWPYESVSRTIMALVPGSVILGFALGAAVYVFQAFRRDA